LAIFTRLCPKIILKNNYSSTNYAKNLIKSLIKRKKKSFTSKWVNGFKGLKETFTNRSKAQKREQ